MRLNVNHRVLYATKIDLSDTPTWLEEREWRVQELGLAREEGQEAKIRTVLQGIRYTNAKEKALARCS